MIDQWMNEGIKAARAGQRKEAARWFYHIVKQDPENQTAWLYFCDVQEDINKQREILLWLANRFPENQGVRRRLQRLDQTNLSGMHRSSPVSQNQWNAASLPTSGNVKKPGVISAQNPPRKKKIGVPAILAITVLVGFSCIAVFTATYFFLKQSSAIPDISPAEVALPDLFEKATEALSTPQECRISFVSGRDGFINIYSMDQNGTNVQQHTHNQDNRYYVSWSPDTSKILFVDEHESKVLISDADGRNEQELIDLQEYEPYDVKWSPDSKKIAYTIVDDRWNVFLNIMDISGYGRLTVNQQILLNDDADIYWAPDSSKVAFASEEPGSNLIIVYADGSGLHRFDTIASWRSISWSPDSKRLFFLSYGNDLSIADETNNDIQKIKKLEQDLMIMASVWAPDGEYIIFSAYEGGTYVIKPDGSDFRQLSSESDRGFWELNWAENSWSPNSEQIALVLENGLYSVSVSGDSKRLLNDNLPMSFQWGSKGEQILMSADNDIYLVDASGNNLRQLTFDGLSITPIWSPGCK